MTAKIPVYVECKDWIMDFDALPDDRPIALGYTGEWEVPCLLQAAELYKDEERFLYLKDSCRVLDTQAFFEAVDATPPGENTFLFSDKNCYLGVFLVSDVFKELRKVRVHSKWDSITNEWAMARRFPGGSIYETGRPYPNHSDLDGRKRMEWHGGNLEVVYGNEIIEKWKSTSGCGCKPNKLKICRHMLSGLTEEEATDARY